MVNLKMGRQDAEALYDAAIDVLRREIYEYQGHINPFLFDSAVAIRLGCGMDREEMAAHSQVLKDVGIAKSGEVVFVKEKE